MNEIVKARRIFLVVTAGGLLIALSMVLASIFHSSAYADLVSLMFPSETPTTGVSGYFHAGLAGGLYSGWSLTLYLVVRNERLAKERALWTAILWGVITWFTLDSAASIANGALYNAIGNTVYFGLLCWPIAMCRRALQE